MFQSPWIRFALEDVCRAIVANRKVSIPVDKVRAAGRKALVHPKVAGFQSPWIRFALAEDVRLTNTQRVSIPVDKVRARSFLRLRRAIRRLSFNPRG